MKHVEAEEIPFPAQTNATIAADVTSKAARDGVTLMEAFCLWHLKQTPGEASPLCPHKRPTPKKALW